MREFISSLSPCIGAASVVGNAGIPSDSRPHQLSALPVGAEHVMYRKS